VSRVELAPELADDFDRILDHLAAHDVEGIPARIQGIIEAFDVLQTNPLIGRPAPLGKRELIIGRGSRGYVALYRYVPGLDTVFVLALRSQSEGGYKHD
jgi:plasmid stabilization system protein ParE